MQERFGPGWLGAERTRTRVVAGRVLPMSQRSRRLLQVLLLMLFVWQTEARIHDVMLGTMENITGGVTRSILSSVRMRGLRCRDGVRCVAPQS
jgi:hypothetical protein